MSSVNPHYTFHYSQPEAYRFSHDSVFLARRVLESEGERLHGARVLDLCAGCGIVGLDLLFHARRLGLTPGIADFLEVQEIYAEHFARNALDFAEARFHLANYRDFKAEPYDLIVSNPPYFVPGRGRLSPSEFKNRCRFFLDADQAALFASIDRLLKPGGHAYVLMRSPENGLLPRTLGVELLEPIRGTPLVRLSKTRPKTDAAP